MTRWENFWAFYHPRHQLVMCVLWAALATVTLDWYCDWDPWTICVGLNSAISAWHLQLHLSRSTLTGRPLR